MFYRAYRRIPFFIQKRAKMNKNSYSDVKELKERLYRAKSYKSSLRIALFILTVVFVCFEIINLGFDLGYSVHKTAWDKCFRGVGLDEIFGALHAFLVAAISVCMGFLIAYNQELGEFCQPWKSEKSLLKLKSVELSKAYDNVNILDVVFEPNEMLLNDIGVEVVDFSIDIPKNGDNFEEEPDRKQSCWLRYKLELILHYLKILFIIKGRTKWSPSNSSVQNRELCDGDFITLMVRMNEKHEGESLIGRDDETWHLRIKKPVSKVAWENLRNWSLVNEEEQMFQSGKELLLYLCLKFDNIGGRIRKWKYISVYFGISPQRIEQTGRKNFSKKREIPNCSPNTAQVLQSEVAISDVGGDYEKPETEHTHIDEAEEHGSNGYTSIDVKVKYKGVIV